MLDFDGQWSCPGFASGLKWAKLSCRGASIALVRIRVVKIAEVVVRNITVSRPCLSIFNYRMSGHLDPQEEM